MEEHILLIGEEPALLKSRALLLSDWRTVALHANQAAAAIEAQSFDAIVIGQTVRSAQAAELIAQSRKLRPAPAILLIRFPGDRASFDVETHLTDLRQSPEWLRARMAALLSERKATLKAAPAAARANLTVES